MNNYPHNENMAGDMAILLAQLVGMGDDVEAVDISSTAHTAVMTNCRMITAIPGADNAIIKVDFTKGDGTTGTCSLPMRNGIMHIRNITKVYYTGSSDVTLVYLHR